MTSAHKTTDHEPFYCRLPGRGCVRVSGPDRHGFLQGLITNDIHKLTANALLYACLLTPQGKFLHDFFIREDGDVLHLDCEGGPRAEDLARRLSVYKLRAQVTIEAAPESEVFAVLNSQETDPESLLYKDPRHTDMGCRAYQKPQGLPERPFEEWDYRRIALIIPDGSRDLRIGQSTLEEARVDRLNGVDYKKGCYVGQELTARMHYRGLGKKHLYALRLTGEPDTLSKYVEILSSCRDIALVLCRDDKIQLIEKEGFFINDS